MESKRGRSKKNIEEVKPGSDTLTNKVNEVVQPKREKSTRSKNKTIQTTNDVKNVANGKNENSNIVIEEEVKVETQTMISKKTNKKLKTEKGVTETIIKANIAIAILDDKIESRKSEIKISDIINISGPLVPEKILDRSFFKQNILDLSKNLLGKIVVRKTKEGIVKCRIVETEAYCGVIDKACHAYAGKKTDKTKWMFAEGGHVYIFSIYGNNFCLNFTSGEVGDPSAVLIRAVEPVDGWDLIKKFRGNCKISKSGKELSNGPGKVCKAMMIDKSSNGHDATIGEDIYLIEDETYQFETEISPRINIDYAEEFVDKPWRYYIKKNVFVSVK